MGHAVASSALLSSFFLCLYSTLATPVPEENFLRCFSTHSSTPNAGSQVMIIHTPNNSTSNYTSLLQSSIQNLRFRNPTTPKPLLIVTPTQKSHVRASIICCKTHGLQLRVRSGGHDYEGLSYLSSYARPFIVVDLLNLRSIAVHLRSQTMWVQAGATLGEVYHKIANASNVLGFPAGLCHTIGTGGHFGAGGIGTLMRKHGLASDKIIDASFIDAEGRILNRKSMGEELFWAIRGGGASSFGVVLEWKIRLVHVPPTVTVFTFSKTLEQGATKLVGKWQSIAHQFPEDLFIRLLIQPRNGSTIQVLFNSLFLGTLEKLMLLMHERFPELGLQRKDCLEMSWIESAVNFSGLNSVDDLLNRGLQVKTFYKAKSDFLEKPISQIGLEGIWKRLLEDDTMYMIIDPMGGKMSRISASKIAFPYRKRYIYNIQYLVRWGDGDDNGEKHLDSIRRLHEYLTPHVSQSPRGAYLNYRDLDLGMNQEGNVSYSTATVWGEQYFGANFKRLARVKGAVDPTNFFIDEQSIPPLLAESRVIKCR
ncbi:hypothetical protein ACLOJK_020462 [Asimina triloba]